MGLLIYFMFLGIFVYGVYLANKKECNNILIGIGIVLIIFQFMAVKANINVPYAGHSKEYFTSDVMYYIAILFYYIGYFIFSIIALLLVYIPILSKKRKLEKKQEEINDVEKQVEQSSKLIDKSEKEKEKQ